MQGIRTNTAQVDFLSETRHTFLLVDILNMLFFNHHLILIFMSLVKCMLREISSTKYSDLNTLSK